ncbi:hypothetical protein [Gloeothece verrucosa]|uniref:Uncharacterized protein n=1 Tax=Gloeothece verrucosa (strain PCC 7822) TaxID=497965 RepID=E0UMB5_GLOV7|nr:hypothetical protein [Gloeothece verrucosa]ADN18095.1 hypothetical protein Cyan7822_6295 [Gloeothece verrucosa PCC 7822]
MSTMCLDLSMLKDLSLNDQAEVMRTQGEIYYSVKELSEKIDDKILTDYLKNLGEDTRIFRLFYLDGSVQSTIPKFYLDEKDVLHLYDAGPAPKAIKLPLKFVNHQTDYLSAETQNTETIIGRQTFYLEVEGSKAAFTAPVGIKTEYIKAANEKYKSGELIDSLLPKGNGVIPLKIVKYYPRPLKPKSQFEKGEEYQILELIGPDPRYNGTKRFLIQQLNNGEAIGEPVETLGNWSLEKHWNTFKDTPCRVVEKTIKDGNTIVKFALSSIARAS